MDGIGLIQDLAMVLLAAGIAGVVCRALGLSVIVGYLLAGILVGPYTPPFTLVLDIDRIQMLSQVGLVFLMFGIGLGLSLSKLGRMGWPTLLATGLTAFLMLNLTMGLGQVVGWTGPQSLFLAAIFMVSSSAVIAKVVDELGFTHERFAQQALSITVLEDVVAVVMLTVLASQTRGEGANVGSLLTGLTAFVVLLVVVGLLAVPRMMRRLEARADPELQTILVAGLLFLLALAAVKAGYSLALGAFLLGAIVAEIPQKVAVERAFTGMRDLFSSVFFVSIGMMIEVRLLLDVWPWILGLGIFALLARGLAATVALTLCGTRLPEARRAGLLLGPLGEFSFIIAQLGVTTGVLPSSYYPLAVGVSIFTVLAVPVLNRFSNPIVAFAERCEPAWYHRSVDAYHGWLSQLQNAPTSSTVWASIQKRLPQLGVEVLFVTGLMIFSRQLLDLLMGKSEAFGIDPQTLGYVFWGGMTVVVLVPLVAIWRNVSVIARTYAQSVASPRLPLPLVSNMLRGVGAIMMVYWLYAIIPFEQLGGWGWVLIGVFGALVIALSSRQLIAWHTEWQESVREVLAEPTPAPGPSANTLGKRKRAEDLQGWDVKLRECVVPDSASYAGHSLAQLAIPTRFDCAVLEVERNGIVITTIRPSLQVYPGDRLLLMGREDQLEAACDDLSREQEARSDADEFRGSVLETFEVPASPWTGQSLAELDIGRATGTRIVGIERHGQRLIAPSGQERLESGDHVLVAGTLAEIAAFRRWLRDGGE